MNKISALPVLLLLLFSCSKAVQQENRIMVTIEPQRYFAEQLVDSLFLVKSLVPAGTSPETYDPTPNQMAELAHSKAYFCIGPIGFENAWIDKLKKNFPQVNFFDNSEGIQFIASGALHRHEGNRQYTIHSGVDPHSWNSPREAQKIVRNMYEALLAIDPENEPVYTVNLQNLSDKIKEIDEKTALILKQSSQKAFIIYHPALTYFARDYGLTQYCIETDGKEPSPEQLKTLIETAKEQNIKTIFIQQEFDRKNAAVIAQETGCKLFVINPLSYNWGEEIIRIAKALSDE
ncbi:MAG: zinc ABC transporter substrate-binding protein [Dysgonamonadaceae bacterium]|nr:zinc ABC transporter substrate-binding protein [Dysgonamonadaceae bacterium]